jgi:hypothetical protein
MYSLALLWFCNAIAVKGEIGEWVSAKLIDDDKRM